MIWQLRCEPAISGTPKNQIFR